MLRSLLALMLGLSLAAVEEFVTPAVTVTPLDADHPPQVQGDSDEGELDYRTIDVLERDLAIPKSELRRMGARYLELKALAPNLRKYPDLIILDHNEVSDGLRPTPQFYRDLATNQVFRVYGKVTP